MAVLILLFLKSNMSHLILQRIEEKQPQKEEWNDEDEKEEKTLMSIFYLEKHTLDALGRPSYRYWRPADEPGSVSQSPSLTTQQQRKSNQIKSTQFQKPDQEFQQRNQLSFHQDWHDHASWAKLWQQPLTIP